MERTIQEEIEKFVSTAWEQITNESTESSAQIDNSVHIYFTQEFHHSAVRHGLSESDALDVYHMGESFEEGRMVRSYGDYELGITYFIDSVGKIVITSIWKQEIR